MRLEEENEEIQNNYYEVHEEYKEAQKDVSNEPDGGCCSGEIGTAVGGGQRCGQSAR